VNHVKQINKQAGPTLGNMALQERVVFPSAQCRILTSLSMVLAHVLPHSHSLSLVSLFHSLVFFVTVKDF